MTTIYGAEAERHYSAGLPVIPLLPKKKIPIPLQWSDYADHLPELEQQEQWIKQHPQSNIGLVLGKASGLVAIDIDHPDTDVIRAIAGALPPSPWVRVGAKGMVIMYKHGGPKTLKTRRMKAKETKETVVELLGHGTQVVLPPSIHPDTQRPYTSGGVDLVDVLDELPVLPEDFEVKIRDALKDLIEMSDGSGTDFSSINFQSAGGRDNAMTQLGGSVAYDVRVGKLTLLEGIKYIETWCDQRTEKVLGDEIDSSKGVTNMFKFLIQDVSERNRVLAHGWDKGVTEEQKKEWGLLFDEEHEEWTVDQIIEYLKDRFENTTIGSLDRRNAIDAMLIKLSKSPTMDDVNINRALSYIQKNGGDGVTVAAYRKEIKRLQSGPIEGVDQTEIAQATIKEYQEKNGQLRSWKGDIWRWVGDHWQVEDDNDILEFIAKEYGSLAAAKRDSDHKGILNIMRRLLPQKLSDSEWVGVNFVNGFVDSDLHITPHSPEHGMTYVLPYRYLPDLGGKFPKFEQLLSSYWSKDIDYKEKRDALQEAMCATLFGLGARYQRAFLLYGIGGTGKSQLLDIITELVPPVARCNIKPEMFKDPNAMIELNEKLLNIAGELPDNRRIAGDKFKEVITGDEVTARDLYKPFQTFRPKAAHWYSSNYLPKSSDTSEGFFRRWQVFDFTRVIPDEEKILDFGKTIIAEEMEAIVSWVVQGYGRLKNMTKYTEPSSHKTVIELMGSHNSTVLAYLNTCPSLEYGRGDTLAEDLFNDYFAYCIKSGARGVNDKKFHLEIKMMHPAKRKFGIEGDKYVGIQIKGS